MNVATTQSSFYSHGYPLATNNYIDRSRDPRVLYADAAEARTAAERERSNGYATTTPHRHDPDVFTNEQLEAGEKSPPKRFSVLNELERRGLTAQMGALIAKRPADGQSLPLELKIAKLRLIELESCYQLKKDTLQDLQARLDQTRESEEGLKNQNEFVMNELTRLRGQLESAMSSEAQLEARIQSLAQDSLHSKRKRQELEGELETTQHSLDQTRITAFQESHELEKTLKETRDKLRKKERQVNAHQREIDKQTLQAAEVEQQYNQFAEKLTSDVQSITAANTQLTELNEQLGWVNNTLKNELATQTQQGCELQEQNTALRMIIAAQEAKFVAINDLLQKRPGTSS